MIGEYALPAAARTARLVRLFRRAAGVMVAVVGLIALVVGIAFARSQTWPQVTGTVQSCETVSARASGRSSPSQQCVVSWAYENREHTTQVGLGSSPRYAGTTVALRVHGDTALEATPPWLGYVTTATGALLVCTGIVVAFRTRRRARG